MSGPVTRNSPSIQQNSIPQNSQPAVQAPSSTASESKALDVKEKNVTKRTDEVAQKTFEKYRLLKAIHKIFSRVFTWIKDIPTKVKNTFNTFLKAVDNCLDKSEKESNDDDDDNVDYSDVGSEDAAKPVLTPPEKIDPKTVQELLAQTISEAPLLEAEIHKLQFQSVTDLQPLAKITDDINEKLEQLSELQNHGELGNLEDKVKEAKAKFVQLKATLDEKTKNKRTQIDFLRKKFELNLGENPTKVTVNKPKKILKPVSKFTSIDEAIRNRDMPPSMDNSRRTNSCYRNSVMTLLWAYPEFFNRIDAAEKKRSEFKEEFEKELKKYDEEVYPGYLERQKKYQSDWQKYQNSLNELKKYEAAEKKYSSDSLNFEKEYKIFKEEREKWEATDKTTLPPETPKKPEEPVKPVQVSKPCEPTKPRRPLIDKSQLLNTLQNYKIACESGNVEIIRKATDILHTSIGLKNKVFKSLHQEDGNEFLEIILEVIGLPIKFCTSKKSLNEPKVLSMITPSTDTVLKIVFPNNAPEKISIEELIDYWGRENESSDTIKFETTITNENGELKKEEKQVKGYTSQERIEGPLLKHLFLNLVRFTNSLDKITSAVSINEHLRVNLGSILKTEDEKRVDCFYKVIGFTIHNGISIKRRRALYSLCTNKRSMVLC